MLSFPLVARELRVQSRQRGTYLARIGWGLAAVAVLLIFSINFPNQSANGRNLLAAIHLCLAVMLFVIAPLGAADAISREKREGTLGLLLLTHLSPAQIVLGKLAAHFIRLLYFALMMAPFLVLPVMMGGVDFQDFLLSFVLLLSIVFVGLAAGLIASTLCASFGAALFGAMIATIVLTWAVGTIAANGPFAVFTHSLGGELPPFISLFVLGPGLLTFPIFARDIASRFFTLPWVLPIVEASLLLLAILLLGFALIFSARRIRLLALSASETSRQAAFRRTFLTPVVWRGSFRKAMSRRLDRNPFIWLEYRTAWSRAARWAMVLLLIAAETMLAIQLPDLKEFLDAHFLLLAALTAFLTLKSSSSFLREKESGAFELLLVTPLTERAIVGGRLRAVVSYYLPAILLLALFGMIGLGWAQRRYSEPGALSMAVCFLTLGCSLVSVPRCGLHFALRCSSFLPALCWTAGLAVLAPLCLWFAFHGLLWMAVRNAEWPMAMFIEHTLRENWWPALFSIAIYHLVLAISSNRATLKLLRLREFQSKA